MGPSFGEPISTLHSSNFFWPQMQHLTGSKVQTQTQTSLHFGTTQKYANIRAKHCNSSTIVKSFGTTFVMEGLYRTNSAKSGDSMKAILISLSLMLIVSTQVHAQESAPIFAQLQINGLTRNMSAVNPLISLKNGAGITFNTKQVTLSIQPQMPPCPQGMFCTQAMPPSVETTLEIVKIEELGCSIKYYAQTPADVITTVYEQVVIEDFTYSLCEMVYQNPGKATYKATGLSQLSNETETATATFVIPEFVRAIN